MDFNYTANNLSTGKKSDRIDFLCIFSHVKMTALTACEPDDMITAPFDS